MPKRVERACFSCGHKLRGKQKRYCSRDCSDRAPRIHSPERACIHRIRFRPVRIKPPDLFHWVGKCDRCHRLEILTREDFAAIHPQFALIDKYIGESGWLNGGRGKPPVAVIGATRPSTTQPARPRTTGSAVCQ